MDIIVRSPTVEDAQCLVELYSQPKAQRETLQLPLPSLAMWQQRLSNVPDGFYSYVAEYEGKVVGQIGLHLAKNRRISHKATFGIGVHDDYHGKGIGSKLIEAIVDLADNWLNLHRLELQVNADNEAAIAVYKKFGFEIEGRAKDFAFRDGQLVDVLYMGRIRPSAS